MAAPYADHAWDYVRAGWRGVLPLRPGTKWPPPTGFTGHDGDWPYTADIQAWTEDHPTGNIALRLPEDTLGIDVDAYGTKPGAQTLAALEQHLGPLPPTIITTSRSDGTSGIRLFRVPPHASWPGQVGDGIEVIHRGHRYAVVWPSIHPEGGTYRWIRQDTGEILTRPPHPGDLPELPAAWVDALQARATATATKSNVVDGEVVGWMEQLRDGRPCGKVADTLNSALTDLTEGRRARHDTMLTGSARLIGYGAWGHAGVNDALTRLRDTFITQTTRPGEGQRTLEDARAEWRRAVAGAVAMQIHQHPTPAKSCSCPLPAFDPDVEESFWNARDILTHIRVFARARRTSPWAVFAIVAARAICAIPPHYVLPAIIGGQASLNLFVGIVARSGGGKGASEAAASEALDVGPIHTAGVGSGEGILHQYVRYQPPKKDIPAQIVQHNTSVLFTASEVDTLSALHQRQGSTLLSELRKVYMGEELSFAYVDPTKRLKVERHRYRAGLVVGIQPSRAGVLLDDVDGGTPQRFLWMPANDPDMPDTPPDEPEPFQWERPTTATGIVNGKVVLDVCATARETIDREHVRRNRGDGDALDGHALLTRLKWAAALAILDERLNVSEEDWALAGIVMQMSAHTREQVQADLKQRRAAANLARGVADGERDAVREETVAEAAIRRVCKKVARRVLSDGEVAHAKLRKGVSSRDRGYFDEAVERLIVAGQIVAVELPNGVTYRAAEGAQKATETA